MLSAFQRKYVYITLLVKYTRAHIFPYLQTISPYWKYRFCPFHQTKEIQILIMQKKSSKLVLFAILSLFQHPETSVWVGSDWKISTVLVIRLEAVEKTKNIRFCALYAWKALYMSHSSLSVNFRRRRNSWFCSSECAKTKFVLCVSVTGSKLLKLLHHGR